MSKRKRQQSAGGKRKGTTKKKKVTQEKASGTVNEESAACGQQAELRCEDDRAAPSSAEERGVAGRSESEGGDGAHKLSPGVKDCFLPLAQNILPGRSSAAVSSCDDDDVAQPSAPEDTTSDQHRGAGEGPGKGDATLHSHGEHTGRTTKPALRESRDRRQIQRGSNPLERGGGALQRSWGSACTPTFPLRNPGEPLPCQQQQQQQQSPFLREKNLRGSAKGDPQAGARSRDGEGLASFPESGIRNNAAASCLCLLLVPSSCAGRSRIRSGMRTRNRQQAGKSQASCEDHSEWDSEFLHNCSTQRFPDSCSLPAPLPILGTESGGSALELPLSIGSISDSQLHEITLG
ncbi:hypothetical protein AOXY_G27826 [Acipenser oxyrinchus oxyrinchus]|uniref:Uncharacterized protein n=1 Tax=Acipenser oxyrinchus oxyrinchus TaxID=40147 RepID=A0AAD8FT47_ACIOX|nr:hypothetical protein AOXY_G27826 [Acipenser oxyrinchus oxyrinchus]